MAILEQYRDRLGQMAGTIPTGSEAPPPSHAPVSSPTGGSRWQRLKRYFPGVWEELRKVTWPSRKEVVRGTWIVIGVSLAAAFLLGAADLLFAFLLEKII